MQGCYFSLTIKVVGDEGCKIYRLKVAYSVFFKNTTTSTSENGQNDTDLLIAALFIGKFRHAYDVIFAASAPKCMRCSGSCHEIKMAPSRLDSQFVLANYGYSTYNLRNMEMLLIVRDSR